MCNKSVYPRTLSIQHLYIPKFLSLVDSLDTLYIMGMKEEFEKAKEWVTNNLDMGSMVRNIP